MELPELEKDPRFDTDESRTENQLALLEILEKKFAEKTLAEWTKCFEPADLLWSAIQSPKEVLEDPQVRENDIII